jgi:outer membrane receptor protein involved in Fe transport
LSSNQSIQRAIWAILGTTTAAAGLAPKAMAADDTTAAVGGLEEIVVTAQRRSEKAQDVPITLQALTAETLTQLNVKTFDDYVKYLPNVTSQGLGPGQNNVYMRGLAAAVGGLQGSGVVGSFPNVAVYLDDQSASLPGRNLDIYAADLERIEVLEGPQGTLFGAGAQAGVVRYITNKPKLDAFEANFDVGYSITAHGDPSTTTTGVLNLPITDKFAVRAVIYNEARGGYINNIPGTFARAASDLGIHYAYTQYHSTWKAGLPQTVPANSVTINNFGLVKDAFNPVTYKGLRASALYKFNEDWNILLSQSFQDMEADGVFSEMRTNSLGQPQPSLSVQQYNPSWNKDKYSNQAWTLNGRIGALKAVYTGGYLLRKVDQVADYTNYARGPYVDYYQCGNPSYTAANGYVLDPAQAFCASPSATWHDKERNEHWSHEFRLSTPDDWRLRAIGGLFYEDYKIGEIVDWNYETATNIFNPIGPVTGYFVDASGSVVHTTGALKGRPYRYNDAGVTFVGSGIPDVNDPSVRPAGVAFFDDIKRGYKQKAIFGSFDYDLIPKKLTFTAGTRYYRIETFEKGAVVGSFGCQLLFNPTAPNPCVNHSNATNLDSLHLAKTYSGFKSRFNISWKPTTDTLLYATWSQGFRAGGFNRPNSVDSGSPLQGIFLPPVIFKPDDLTNKEIGWKTEWLNHRLQINGAIYQEDWKDAQISVFDPGVTGNLTFTTNGGTYRVRGLETTMTARVTHGLTVSAGAAWNSSELSEEARILDLSGNPIIWGNINYQGKPLSNPAGVKGDPLAGAPPFQGNLRVRYDFHMGDYGAFWQVAGQHSAHQYSSTDRLTKDLQGNSIAYNNPAYTLYDAALGLSKDAWVVQLNIQNVLDEKADLWANARQWYKAVTVNRPRTMSLTFTYKFSGPK